MSVPKGLRTKGKFEILTTMDKLVLYTFRICTNEKHFPKRYRWCVSNEIIKEVNEIADLIYEANDVYIEDFTFDDDIRRRRSKQKEALEKTSSLLRRVTFAYDYFNMTNDEGSSINIQYWTESIKDVKRMIRAWMRSDKERFNL